MSTQAVGCFSILVFNPKIEFDLHQVTCIFFDSNLQKKTPSIRYRYRRDFTEIILNRMETEKVNYTSASGLIKIAPNPATLKTPSTGIVKRTKNVTKSLMLP